ATVERLDTVNRDGFDRVIALADAVVALYGVSLGVLIREHGALRLHHSLRRVILGGNHFESVALTTQFGIDVSRNLGVEGRDALAEFVGRDAVECTWLRHRNPFVSSRSLITN